MSMIVNANYVICMIVCGTAIFVGLDLKKWLSWLCGLYGFVSGFLIGLSNADIRGGLELGALFAFIVLYGGAMTRFHKKRFMK
jgi:hypothetical protein